MNEDKISEEMKVEQFSDRMDVLRHVSEIKLKLKNDITNDFVLARLSEKDKEYIVEMTGNAYFSKKLLDLIEEKGEEWIYKDGKYTKEKLSQLKKDKIKAISTRVFDSYMTRIYMVVVLNRNVDKNYLINVLSGYGEKNEEGMELNKNNELKNTVNELLADRDNEKEK
jgi:hypothetical protein